VERERNLLALLGEEKDFESRVSESSRGTSDYQISEPDSMSQPMVDWLLEFNLIEAMGRGT
jgi:hypothetical protein